MSPPDDKLWQRPHLVRHGPRRTAGTFYRTAETEQKGTKLGGVTLNEAEDAVVAAVRMAYKVASEQVDRSTRLAQRLRTASKRAIGSQPERKALDATEQLVFRTMMGGLSWFESIASEEDSPLKRMLAIQYKIVGSMLGIERSEKVAPTRIPPEEPARAPDTGGLARPRSADLGDTTGRVLKIRHTGDKQRAVRVVRFDVGDLDTLRIDVVFYPVEPSGKEAPPECTATLEIRGRGDVTLYIDTPPDMQPGLWRAAVCSTEGPQRGLQVGCIEISV
jgi:hypothetical protein